MRFTKYEPSKNSMFPYRLRDEELSTELDAIHKLGPLEDIEDELDIDLQIIGNSIVNGIYISTSLGIEHLKGKYLCFDKNEKCILAFISPHPAMLYFEDYGKTWALTKEELL